MPAAPVVAALAVLLCLYLMLNLTGGTWVRFLVWMGLGLVVYFGYGARHSRLGHVRGPPVPLHGLPARGRSEDADGRRALVKFQTFSDIAPLRRMQPWDGRSWCRGTSRGGSGGRCL